MQFAMLPERLRRLILLFTLPAFGLSACTTPIVVSRPASSCLSLVPPSLRDKTPGAPLPTEATVGAWAIFGDAQTGQLDKSNVDKQAALSIVSACEARDAEAVAAIEKHRKKPL